MLQEPQLSPYDLQFQVLGFPVRISWWFWLGAAVIGWNKVSSVDYTYARMDLETPGTAVLLLVHALALLISILVHELGHCFLFRHFGSDSRIVLYHFGGLAIPGAFTAWNAARRRLTSRPQDLLAISAAGPFFQLILGLFIWTLATYFQIGVDLTFYVKEAWGLPLPEVRVPESAIVYVFVDTLVFVSILWALVNLLPIMPLDGGQIMREILRMRGHRNPMNAAALVSMITAGLAGWYAFGSHQQGSGLMCIALVASNYQLFQATRYGSY